MAVRQLPILRGIGQAASRKVKSSRGESIAEVLVAMLISVVALTILAVMITSTGNILKRSQAQMNLYNEAAETLVQRTSPSGTGGTVTMTEGAETWRSQRLENVLVLRQLLRQRSVCQHSGRGVRGVLKPGPAA